MAPSPPPLPASTSTSIAQQDLDTIVEVPLAIRYRSMKRDLRKRVAVRQSPIHGRGLFAITAFTVHELVIEYVGELVRPRVSDIREKQYQEQGLGCYFFGFPPMAGAETLVLDATKKGNEARYMNHSCAGNVYAKAVQINNRRRLLIFARRTIKAGEEITLNYMFAKSDPLEEKVACLCKENICRGYLF